MDVDLRADHERTIRSWRVAGVFLNATLGIRSGRFSPLGLTKDAVRVDLVIRATSVDVELRDHARIANVIEVDDLIAGRSHGVRESIVRVVEDKVPTWS